VAGLQIARSAHDNRGFILFVCQRKDTDHVLSNDAVSFHYVSPGQMYVFDFLLYQLNRHWPSSSAADRRHVTTSAVPTVHSTRNRTVTI